METTANIQNSHLNPSVEKLKNEVEIDFFKSQGPGGQRKNKRETAVRLRHLPTGIIVTATESRYQARNITVAFERLIKKINLLNRTIPRRIPTKPSKASAEKRLLQKKKRSIIKNLRAANGL